MFSHCPSVDAVIADADSAAYEALMGIELYNGNGQRIGFIPAGESTQPLQAEYHDGVFPDEVRGSYLRSSLSTVVGNPDDYTIISAHGTDGSIGSAQYSLERLGDEVALIGSDAIDTAAPRWFVSSLGGLMTSDHNSSKTVLRANAAEHPIYFMNFDGPCYYRWHSGITQTVAKGVCGKLKAPLGATGGRPERYRLEKLNDPVTHRDEYRLGLGSGSGLEGGETYYCIGTTWGGIESVHDLAGAAPGMVLISVKKGDAWTYIIPSSYGVSHTTGKDWFLFGDYDSVWIRFGPTAMTTPGSVGIDQRLVLFDYAGGRNGTDEWYKSWIVRFGSELVFPSAPAISPDTGSVFVGWRDTATGKVWNVGEKLTMSGAVEGTSYQAVWVRESDRFSVTFDTGRHGGTFSGSGGSAGWGNATSGSTSYTAKIPNENNRGLRGHIGVYLPSSGALNTPRGFIWKGWATQAWNEASQAYDKVDAHGNPVYNDKYEYYDITNDRVVTNASPDGVMGWGSSAGRYFFTDRDVTWYAIFAIDLTFQSPGRGPTFIANNSRELVIWVACNNLIPFPAVRTEPGWEFGYWFTRLHVNGQTRYDEGTGNISRTWFGTRDLVPKIKLDAWRLGTLSGFVEDPSLNRRLLIQWVVDVECTVAPDSPADASISGAKPTKVEALWWSPLPTANDTKTHHFSGWSMPSNSSGTGKPAIRPDGNEYYYMDYPGQLLASWEPNEYSVKLVDADGHELQGTPFDDMYAVYGVEFRNKSDGSYNRIGISLPQSSMPRREGFTCVGVARRADLTVPERFYMTNEEGEYEYADKIQNAVFSNVFDDDTASNEIEVLFIGGKEHAMRIGYLYPIWKAVATWDFAGGAETAPTRTAKTINNGGFPTVVCPSTTRAGFSFGGWKVTYAHGATDDTLYAAGDTVTLKGDGTLTAQWIPIVSIDVPLSVTARVDALDAKVTEDAPGYLESRCGDPLVVTAIDFTPLEGARQLFDEADLSAIRLELAATEGDETGADVSFALDGQAIETAEEKLAAFSLPDGYLSRVPVRYRFAIPDKTQVASGDITLPVASVAFTVALAQQTEGGAA